MKKLDGGKVILYKNKLEVQLREETVWLTAHHMAKLFDIDRTGIVRHIHNKRVAQKINLCKKCKGCQKLGAGRWTPKRRTLANSAKAFTDLWI